jgi:hypothetical protein
MISTQDNATWNSVAKIQGELTLSASDVNGITVVEDITGITAIYILDTANTADYVVKTGTVSGTIGNQLFTYTTPNASPATSASDETKWKQASYVGTEKPKEIAVENITTTTQIDTLTPVTTGDDLVVYNATDGAVSRTAGTVTPTNIGGAGVNLIPDLTSNTSSGTASGTTPADPLWAEWKAFDRDNSTHYMFAGSVGYLQYRFTTSQTINKYVIVGHNNAADLNRMPKNWTFEGSNDGSNWTVLDTQTNQTSWASGVGASYSFSNLVSYSYFKISISSNNGGSYTTIDTLEMIQTSITKYQVPITATTVPVTKAFFDDNVTYFIAVEDTENRCIMKDEVLAFVSSTTSEYVGTSPISGLIKTGDTIQLDGVTDVVTSNVVESPAGTYTCTIPVQGSAPISAKVLDKRQALATTRTYNAGNGNFDVTMTTPLNVSGRAIKIGVYAEKTGTTVDIDTAVINLNKEG